MITLATLAPNFRAYTRLVLYCGDTWRAAYTRYAFNFLSLLSWLTWRRSPDPSLRLPSLFCTTWCATQACSFTPSVHSTFALMFFWWRPYSSLDWIKSVVFGLHSVSTKWLLLFIPAIRHSGLQWRSQTLLALRRWTINSCEMAFYCRVE